MNMYQITFFILLSWIHVFASEPKIFCYWNTSSYYRKDASFHAWHIDTTLCTHLAYSSFSITPKGAIHIVDKYLHIEFGLIKEITNLRRLNKELKIMASVGREDSTSLFDMVANIRKRDNFFSSVIDFLYKWHFDGIDLDWKLPAQWHRKKDRNDFVIFLEELKIILQEHQFILSITVAAEIDKSILASFDIPKIAKYVDIINLIPYSFGGSNKKHLTHTMTLCDENSDLENSIQLWVAQSRAPSKLLLGIPFFAEIYTFQDINITVLDARKPCKLFEQPGSTVRHSGYMGYNEFCKKTSKWVKKYNIKKHMSYAYKHNQWLSYNDARSIFAKSREIKNMNLGGAMVWSIDTDDYQGNCGEVFGLLRALNVALGKKNLILTKVPTTESMGMCPKDGFFRISWNCSYYYECRDGQRIDYECLSSMYFDEAQGQCVSAKEVQCPQDFITWRPGMKPYSFNNIPLNLKIVR